MLDEFTSREDALQLLNAAKKSMQSCQKMSGKQTKNVLTVLLALQPKVPLGTLKDDIDNVIRDSQRSIKLFHGEMRVSLHKRLTDILGSVINSQDLWVD